MMDDAETPSTEPATPHSNEGNETIAWTASEYVAHEKTVGWHGLLFGAAGLLVVAVFAISKDILASIVILLSAVAVSVYARKKPSERSYQLDSAGVSVDGKEYPYASMRSFSIVEEGVIDSVWLKPLQRFAPTLVIYFPPEDGEKIQKLLSKFLPFEEKNLDLIDRVTKRIRF